MLHFAPRNRPLRVLCMEEDAIQRKLFEACLDVLGAEAVFAGRAARGAALFHDLDVDIVFIDIDRHSADELAAFEAMRAERDAIPVVVVTNNDCGWREEDYRDAGFAGMFLKPVEPLRLYRAMDDVLRQSHQPPLLISKFYAGAHVA